MRRLVLPLVFALVGVACSDTADETAPTSTSATLEASTTTAPPSTTAPPVTTTAPPSTTSSTTTPPLDPAGGVAGAVIYQRDGLGDVAEDAGLFGFLRLRNGCLVSVGLEPGDTGAPLLFPFGTTWDAETQAVTFPDGVTVQVGDRFETGGGGHATDAIEFWVESPAAIEALQACGERAFVIRHPVVSFALDPAGGVDRPFGAEGGVIYTAECEGCPAEEALGRFELTLVDRCLTGGIDGPVLAWPFGTTWNPGWQRVELIDGRVLELGDRFEAGGGFHDDLGRFATARVAIDEFARCGGSGFVIQSPPSLGWG
ncbi:MAG: hypothetical protein AAF081_01790 [Actinomycetota bacterium]